MLPKNISIPYLNRIQTGALSNPCSLLNSANFSLDAIENNKWLDKINGNDFELGKSNAFKFNGTDNYIIANSTNTNMVGNYTLSFWMKRNATVSGVEILLTNRNSSSLYEGMQLYQIDSDELSITYDNGASSSATLTTSGAGLGDNNWHYVFITYNGTNTMVYVDGNIVRNMPQTKTYTSPTSSLRICTSYTTGINNANISLTHINIYNSHFLPTLESSQSPIFKILFQTGSGNKVYDVNSDTEFTILGTVDASSHVLQDNYHYNILNGFNEIGGAKIPASKLNPGFDVLGNVLTNPAVNGHNGAETLVKAPDVQILKDNDDGTLFTSGVANALSFTDLVNSGKLYVNTVDYTNDKRQLTQFDHVLSDEEKIKLDKCYLKSNTLPSGYEWLVDDDGNYLIDDNGEYIYG